MNFQQLIQTDLRDSLVSQNLISTPFPECPDLDALWEDTCQAYIGDGIREFTDYPTTSLGWMMYIGMAYAQWWDQCPEVLAKGAESLYGSLKAARGYDEMDEYIREEVLGMNEEDFKRCEKIVSTCSTRLVSALRRSPAEPGTPEAFRAYVTCLHELYLCGIAVELKRLGYNMVEA